MSLPYIVRVALNWNDVTKQNKQLYDFARDYKGDKQIFIRLRDAYQQCRKDSDFYFRFGHDVGNHIANYTNEQHIDTLKKFTACVPDITVTFYIQYNNYEDMNIITIRGDDVLQNICEYVGTAICPKNGLVHKSNITSIDALCARCRSIVYAERRDSSNNTCIKCDNGDDVSRVQRIFSTSNIILHLLNDDPTNIDILNDITGIFYDVDVAINRMRNIRRNTHRDILPDCKSLRFMCLQSQRVGEKLYEML